MINITPKDLPDFDQEYERRALVIDIESEGVDDFTVRKILAIGMKTSTGKCLICKDTERETMEEFAKRFNRLKNPWIIGHNIWSYDIQHIMMRCLKLQIPLNISYCKDRTGRIIERPHLAGGRVWFRYKWIRSKNYKIIDTLFLVNYWDAIHAKLSDHTLKTSAIELGLRDARRLELSHQEIQDAFKNDVPKLLRYLEYDLEDTYMLCKKLLVPYYYMQTVVPMDIQEMLLSTTAKKVERLLENHYGKENLPCPDDTSQPIAGAITDDAPGLYKNVFKIDVSSLYPSIMLRYSIYPRKDKEKVFLHYLYYLTKERLNYKKKSKTDAAAAAISEAYKILINSFFGFLSSHHPYNDVRAAEAVTAYGRKIIRLMWEELINAGCVVVEIDTDGIYAKNTNGKTPDEIVDLINEKLPDHINVELEHEADWIYIHGSKNYIVNVPGKMVLKGIYKKRDKYPLHNEFTLGYIQAALKSESEAISYYNKVVADLRSGNFDIEKLTMTRKIAVTWKRLLCIGKVGEKVRYYEGCNVRGEPAPARTGPYNSNFYVNDIKKIASGMTDRIFNNELYPDGLHMETYNLFEEEAA